MTLRASCAALVGAAVFGIVPNSAAKASPVLGDCSSMFRDTIVAGTAVSARDLAELRDLGPTGLGPGDGHIFSVSPDGKFIALQVRKADPDSNEFCQSLIVLPASGSGPFRVVDAGGNLILTRSNMLGRAGVATGLVRPIEPVWSPDGQSIAFLKDMDGTVQVWIAKADGSGSHAASSGTLNVERFSFGTDGHTLVYSVNAALAAQSATITRESRQGFRFDGRMSPAAGAVPFPAPTSRLAYFSTHSTMPMPETRPEEIERLALAAPERSPTNARGQKIRLVAVGGAPLRPVMRLNAQDEHGLEKACAAVACNAPSLEAWWAPGDRKVRFLRREGPANSETAIYEWRPGTNQAKRLLSTTALLIDCQQHGGNLFCMEETSLQPRRLVRFDRTLRRKSVVFDPNSHFGQLRLSQVQRLFWRNSFGIETFGDLVYPLGYKHGARYPLIVVQYTSRGFLRGGTGDEFPIQAFAANDYFVLSLQRPDALVLADDARTSEEADARLLDGFRDRESVLSSIEVILNQLITEGLVDRQHVGITGLSDGSSTVQFAAVNSSLFAAGSASGCCWERSQDFLLNEGIADHFARSGWPRATEAQGDFWRRISLAQNARTARFPLLLQMADDEYLGALESVTALRQAGHPIDMYVFPGEHHVKWQPAHKLAAYERNLAWFDFWLRGKLPADRVAREAWTAMQSIWLERQQADKRSASQASATIRGDAVKTEHRNSQGIQLSSLTPGF
ncbi:Atxe2 family lasso peptide isopeptidase [Novosphingobium lindaniclasticum]